MLTHIDCFSGTGGICTGLHAAGFETKIAIESIESCVDTYKANHPTVNVIHSDIRDVTKEQILPFIPKNGIDLLTSGMPCETFSTAGNTSRSFYDERQFLFREAIRIASMTNARLVLFENVPAIMTKTISKESKKRILDVLKRDLIDAGYKYFIEVILNAEDFGIPQKRSRFFILSSRDIFPLDYPKSKKNLCKVTVDDAFTGLINVIPNSMDEPKSYNGNENAYTRLLKDPIFWRRKEVTECSYQKAMKHRSYTLQRFSLLKQGESLKDLFGKYQGEDREKLQQKRILPKKMFIKRNYRLISTEPSPTVTSHCLDEFVHPLFDRALTVRECARLQSFPDSYDFCGGPYIIPHINRFIQDKYEQIGDAVPPLLAYYWGRIIQEILGDE